VNGYFGKKYVHFGTYFPIDAYNIVDLCAVNLCLIRKLPLKGRYESISRYYELKKNSSTYLNQIQILEEHFEKLEELGTIDSYLKKIFFKLKFMSLLKEEGTENLQKTIQSYINSIELFFVEYRRALQI
jgi:hypothetical protein